MFDENSNQDEIIVVDDENIIQLLLARWIAFNVTLMVSLIMLSILVELETNLSYLMIPFFLEQILTMTIVSSGCLDSSLTNRARAISSSVLRLAFYLFLALYLEMSFPLYVSLIPLMLELVMKMLLSYRRFHKCIRLSALFDKIFLGSVIMCMSFISLKIDFDVDMDWKLALWTVWAILFMMIILSILMIALIGAALVSYRAEESNTEDLTLVLWLFVVNTGYWISAGFFMNTLLDSDLSLSEITILPLVILTGIIILTLKIRNTLIAALLEFLGLNNIEEIEKSFLFSTKIVWVFKKVPQMLLRSSNTYFVEVDMLETDKYVYRESKSLDFHEKVTKKHRRSKSNIEIIWTNQDKKDDGIDESWKEATCLVCCEKESDAVVMKCGHGGICIECGKELWQKKGCCHMCRKQIKELLLVKAFSTNSHAIKVAGSINKS